MDLWELSDISHANVLASLRNIDDEQDEPVLLVNEADVRRLVAATLESWWRTTDRLVQLMGWSFEEYESRRRFVKSNVQAMLEPLLKGAP